LVSGFVHFVVKYQLIWISGQHIINLEIIGYLALEFLLITLVLEQILESLLALVVGGALVEQPSLDDQLVQAHLVGSLVEDLFFDHRVRHQAVHTHFVFLADSVGSVLSLQIHLRIPVTVEYYDCVGRLQV